MIEELKRLLLRRPFQPFQVVLDDGQRLTIARPGQMAVGETEMTYAWPSPHRPTFQQMRIRQVVGVEPAPLEGRQAR